MILKSRTFYYLYAEDMDQPILAYAGSIDGRDDRDEDTYVFMDITITGDRTYGFRVLEWLEKTDKIVRFKSAEHGIVVVRRLTETTHEELRKCDPFCSCHSWREMVDGVGGVRVG